MKDLNGQHNNKLTMEEIKNDEPPADSFDMINFSNDNNLQNLNLQQVKDFSNRFQSTL